MHEEWTRRKCTFIFTQGKFILLFHEEHKTYLCDTIGQDLMNLLNNSRWISALITSLRLMWHPMPPTNYALAGQTGWAHVQYVWTKSIFTYQG